MLRSEQIALGNRLLEYIETKTTAYSDSVYRQPVADYICESRAEIERRLFFRETMLCVGLSGRLPKPGSFITDNLSGVPILLTRDSKSRVHGFLNVCRHRGSQVAQDCGNAKSFVCPYHAWTYDLEGKLVSRPEEAAFDSVDRTTHGLTPLPAVEQDGLLWVCPTPGRSTDIEKKMAGLSPEIAAYNLQSFHHHDSRIFRRRMNWKLVVDTFLESYHFCVLHKNTICSIFYDNLATFDAWGPNFRVVSARRTMKELKTRPESEWDIMEQIVGIYVLFPNTVMIWQLDHLEVWHIYPSNNDPNQSVTRLDLYTPGSVETEKAKRHWDSNLDLAEKVVEEEDFPVGEGIQHGFHSAAQSHITFGTNEPALAHYHRSITEAVNAAARKG